MKAIVQNYKASILQSDILRPYIDILWEFYITHALCKSAGQQRALKDYGIKSLPLSDMLKIAQADANVKILLANTINKTLDLFDLTIDEGVGKERHPKEIDIDTIRIVCSTPFSISDEDPPKARVGEAESILTHVRNALAHGNIYLFNNGNMMLEDKAQDGKTITARMILKQQTLIDWIYLIDSNGVFYTKATNAEEASA